MNTLHLPFGVPRKELINALQKGLVIVLFAMLLAFAGMYFLVNSNLERQDIQQGKLSELLGLVHSAEEHWLQWLLVEDRQTYDLEEDSHFSASYLHQRLVSEYGLIELNLTRFDTMLEADLSSSIALLDGLSQKELDTSSLTDEERRAVYRSFETLESISDGLLQIRVNVEYERQAFSQTLIWIHIALFVVIAAIILFLCTRFARQLRSGLSALHYVVDHRKRGHVSAHPPRNVIDEFTDLGHLVDNELASRDFDISQQSENLNLIEKALAEVDEPFLVTNERGDIAWLSAGAERLWFRNTSLFESLFGIDAGLDDPTGERIADSILLSDEALKLNLSDGVYWLSVSSFLSDQPVETENLQRFISIRSKSDTAELEILHHSLKLLEQDVWSVPIRVLRQESPYAGFATSLEIIRRKVMTLFDFLNAALMRTNPIVKITKLQQIASLIDEKTDHNEASVNELVPMTHSSFEGMQVELNTMAWLSGQVRDSFILGYELVLQRLALVEKDLSSDVFLLGEVERYLNEVRAGVLNSLAATEGESESVRRRFAVDIEHDISQVQEQIEGMKSMAASTLSLLESDRSVGVARLERARESVSEMIDRIHDLMAKMPADVSVDAEENVSAQKSNDE
ncbi:hypothetical protein [Marinomonas shanghaiensis]|uniref:hypothetical protein n=1 Tax=Marinomonas shanghaiensis TaxID=2202418 RepID=UPI000DB9E7E9|nr:hypothetical protein [Marinomonas shanghaiensis]